MAEPGIKYIKESFDFFIKKIIISIFLQWLTQKNVYLTLIKIYGF